MIKSLVLLEYVSHIRTYSNDEKYKIHWIINYYHVFAGISILHPYSIHISIVQNTLEYHGFAYGNSCFHIPYGLPLYSIHQWIWLKKKTTGNHKCSMMFPLEHRFACTFSLKPHPIESTFSRSTVPGAPSFLFPQPRVPQQLMFFVMSGADPCIKHGRTRFWMHHLCFSSIFFRIQMASGTTNPQRS